MKHFAFQLAAVSSLFTALAFAATHPQYGGTVHIVMRIAPVSLDPATSQPDPVAAGNLARLLFETLVTVDEAGNPKPALAVAWQSARDGRHWNLALREGVKFEDGTPLTSDVVAASLRFANPGWTVFAQGNSVEIDLEDPETELPAELALPRNSILKRSDFLPKGTGPFHISQWEPGKKLLLIAAEDYWGGRPFLNSVEIEFNRGYRDQLAALQMGRADLVEIAPEQAQRVETGGRRILESAPLELLALVFSNDNPSTKEIKLRDALALSIDRSAIKAALLGGQGDPAGGILPNWITGYEFLFPSDINVAKALEERGEVNQAPAWTLSYDSSDPLIQLIAERIALNARDVGLRVTPVSAPNGDLRLVRVRLESPNPLVALKQVATRLGLPQPKSSDHGMPALYQSESTVLQNRRVIPLFHVPVNYGLGSSLKGWRNRRDARWPLADLWLSAEKN
jgi:peptide/nickel transport system substrate-binding protein